MEKKVVIILTKEEAESYINSVKRGIEENLIDLIPKIEEGLDELSKPEPEHTINLGSVQFNVKKDYCPKCGHQIYPVIESVKCRDCEWRGFDKDLIYKPTTEGGESYQSHCPECDSIKIKRLKDEPDKQGCVQPL